MSKHMSVNTNKLTNLYHNTDIILDKAVELLRFKRDYNSYYDGSPKDYSIAVAEFQAAQELLEEMVVDDNFVDEDSYTMIFNTVSRYKDYLDGEYPITARLVTQYLNELKSYHQDRFAA